MTAARTATEALACPTCRDPLEADAGALRCVSCGRSYRARGGIFDFAPELASQPGLAQRFMEARPVVTVYERWFRPALTRLVSPLGYDEEERYLERWLGDVSGGAGGAILDLACGTGRYTRWLGERAGDRAVLGLDLSRAMLARARADAASTSHGELTFARASALALPIASGALGAACSFGALHLFPDPGLAIAELGRALTSGGTFTCLTVGAAPAGARRPLELAISRAANLRFFERDELAAWLAAAGLTPLDFTHRGAMLLFAARKR